MLGIIGNILINTAMISGLLALIGYFWYSHSGRSSIFRLSNWLFGLKGLLILAASGLLIYLLLTHQFNYFYVYSNTSLDLQFKYLISAYWGGQEGSFMLWILLSAIVGVLLMKYVEEPYRGPVLFFMTLNQLFLLSMISGVDLGIIKLGASPFRTIAEAMPNAPFLQANPDFIPQNGKGLNDLLKSPWMIFHPPFLFSGFALMAVPYCYALAALWRKRYDAWIRPALPWTLAANLALFIAILLGAYWAYVTLSFGGFWAWDPVENASLIPWLIGTAGIHTMIIQRKYAVARKTSLMLMILAYAAVVYETFLTRSGVLADASVHSFVDLGLYKQLVLFIGTILLAGVGLIIYRSGDLPAPARKTKLLSSEFLTFSGAMVLLLMALVITLGTSSPIIGRLFVAHPTPPEISFYNQWTLPLAIVIAVLTVLGQYLFWKRYDSETLAGALLLPLVITTLATFATIFIGHVRSLLNMLYLFTAWFALVGNSFVMVRLVLKKPRLIGGTLSHIGFSLLLFGVLASSVYQNFLLDTNTKGYNDAIERGEIVDSDGNIKRQKVNYVELKLDEPKLVNNKYRLTYEGYTLRDQDRPGQQEYQIKVQPVGSRESYYIQPQVYPMTAMSSAEKIEWSVDVDVAEDFTNDIYMYVAGSSYVDRINKLKEKQKATADSVEGDAGTTRDSVATLVLTKGATKQLGDYRFTFRDYSPADSTALPDSTSIAVHALVDVQYKANRDPVTLRPLYVIFKRDGENWVFSPPAYHPSHDIGISFTHINPNTGEIELQVEGIADKPNEEWVLLLAEEKPFVSLVWLGSFMIIGGFLVSIYRRKKQNGKSS